LLNFLCSQSVPIEFAKGSPDVLISFLNFSMGSQSSQSVPQHVPKNNTWNIYPTMVSTHMVTTNYHLLSPKFRQLGICKFPFANYKYSNVTVLRIRILCKVVAKHVLLILRNGPFLDLYPKLSELKFC
jgi:hypothetical protein